MGLGSTAKKIQKLSDIAEKLYANVKDMRERVVSLEQSADETHERVARLERRIERQSVLVEALAEREGIDVEATIDEAGIDPVELDETEDADDGGDADGDEDDGGDADGDEGGDSGSADGEAADGEDS